MIGQMNDTDIHIGDDFMFGFDAVDNGLNQFVDIQVEINVLIIILTELIVQTRNTFYT
jgi:hypothetical protein